MPNNCTLGLIRNMNKEELVIAAWRSLDMALRSLIRTRRRRNSSNSNNRR
jgi:hypothetical protein